MWLAGLRQKVVAGRFPVRVVAGTSPIKSNLRCVVTGRSAVLHCGCQAPANGCGWKAHLVEFGRSLT